MTYIELAGNSDWKRQIEVDIAHALLDGEPAELDAVAVEQGYQLFGLGHCDRTIDDKCTAILDVLKIHYAIAAHYVVVGGTVIFTML
jgi:hypothetical protein